MSDKFETFSSGLESPAAEAFPVTPSDTIPLVRASRALNVTTSGAVRVTTISGDEATVFIAAGIAFPLRAEKIWQTGTTAVGIVALL